MIVVLLLVFISNNPSNLINFVDCGFDLINHNWNNQLNQESLFSFSVLNMDKKYFVKANAFKNTFCIFKEVPLSELGSKSFDFKSKSGSSYYYTPLGMFRLSNHWGRLANSKWRLEPLEIDTASKFKLGFALWKDFYPDNATENLYYIEADFNSNTVNYQHKNNPDFDNKAVLRTSFETTKRIKQIRNILNLTSWAKHFDCDDLNLLRQDITNQLIYSNKTLEEIKRQIA